MSFRALQNPPDAPHDLAQEVSVAVVSRHRELPVPLVHVRTVVVIEEVVLADCAHVGAEALAGAHLELAERQSLPLRRGLHDLGVNGVEVAVVCDVESDGNA